MKRSICALLAALLLFGAAASAAPAPLPEGMAYLAACRVEGETTGGVTFAVTQAAYDGASLTLEVLLTPNDEDTALMDNQVELPPEDSWSSGKRRRRPRWATGCWAWCATCAASRTRRAASWPLSTGARPVRRGRTMTYTFEVPLKNAPEAAQVELYFGVNEDLGFRFEQDARLLLRVPLLALVPLTATDAKIPASAQDAREAGAFFSFYRCP